MAPTAFAALAAEMPEFDPEAAPGSEGENDGMEAFPSLRDEPKPYNVLATGKPNTLAEAFEVLMFPTEFHDPFFNLVGAYADAPAEVIAALPFGTYREAVANHLVLEDGRSASLFEQGRFYKFFKDLVKLLAPCPTPPPSSSSVPLGSQSAGQPIVVTMAETEDKLLFRDYIDQTLPGSFKLLQDEEIAQLRERYFKATGAHPPNEERPSDEQISAMAHRMRDRTGGRVWAPFAEFAVFGPFDGRSTKLRTFTAMVLNRDGAWQQRTLRGPSSWAQWEASWKVYEVLLIMLGIAEPGPLKAYFQSIRRLADLYRKDWPTIACLEEEMRAEQWNRVRQEILQGTTAPPSSWNPSSPWNSIIGASRPFYTLGLRTDWWNERITLLERSRGSKPNDLPSTSTTMPNALPSFVSMGIIPEIAGKGSGSASSTHPPPAPHAEGGSRRQNRKRRLQNQQPQQQNQRQKGQTGLPLAQKNQNPDKDKTCWNCGKVGHVSKDCRSNPKGGKNRGKGSKA